MRPIMRRTAQALSGAALLILAANDCRAQGPPSADPAGLQHSAFTLEGARYRILLPQRATVVPPSGQVDRVTIRDASKSQRLERLVILGGPRRGAQASDTRMVKLASGGVLRYRMSDHVGGGSGGTIAELTGELQIGTRTLTVTCTDQGELFREPDWCVPYLHHLEIDGQR